MAADQNKDFISQIAVDFLLREWDRMWTTKASLEQRAITVITTSGVLVTLAFGFATAITKNTKFANFHGAERVVLVVSLGLFAISALIALTVNIPKGYSVPELDGFRGANPERPGKEDLGPLKRALEAGDEENNRKARRLALAFAAQLAAVATLALAVGLVTA